MGDEEFHIIDIGQKLKTKQCCVIGSSAPFSWRVNFSIRIEKLSWTHHREVTSRPRLPLICRTSAALVFLMWKNAAKCQHLTTFL